MTITLPDRLSAGEREEVKKLHKAFQEYVCIKNESMSSHDYDSGTAERVISKIIGTYQHLFNQFLQTMKSIEDQENMMYGLDQEELELMQRIFSETEGIEEVVLYGSRPKGTYKPFSDVDITLKGESLSDEDLTDVCYKLSESLLPYFYDVSLFRQLTSPTLTDHINRRGKTIYKKETSDGIAP